MSSGPPPQTRYNPTNGQPEYYYDGRWIPYNPPSSSSSNPVATSGSGRPRYESTQQSSSSYNAAVSPTPRNVQPVTSDTSTVVRNQPSYVKDGRNPINGVSNRLITSNLANYTDPELYQELRRPVDRAIVSGPGARQESLDNSYKLHKSKFFEPGRVFELLYSEPTNASTVATFNDKTVETDEHGFVRGTRGTYIYQKLRRFVVFRDGHNSCTALGIFTYRRHAAGAMHVEPADHGIIYTGKEEPAHTEREEDRNRRCLLGYKAIRVNTDDRTERLDPLSRINYGKVYNVEHNLQIRNIGKIHDNHLKRFLNNGWDALRQNRTGAPAVQDAWRDVSNSSAQAGPSTQQYGSNMARRPSIASQPTSVSYSLNSVTQGMSNIRLGQNSGNQYVGRSTTAARDLDPAVKKLAERILAKRPDMNWPQCVAKAQQKIDEIRAESDSEED